MSHATKPYLTLDGIMNLRTAARSCDKSRSHILFMYSRVSKLANKGGLQCRAQLPASRRVRHQEDGERAGAALRDEGSKQMHCDMQSAIFAGQYRTIVRGVSPLYETPPRSSRRGG